MRNWQSDVDLDLAKAHTIVSRRFPAYAEMGPQFLGRGWDNLCIEYPGGIVFRFPTRKLGAEIAINEIAALPNLSLRLPIAIPAPAFLGEPAGDYPYRFFGYQKIPGRAIRHGTANAAKALGKFLAALHAIDPGEPPYSHLPGDTLKRADRLMEKIELRGGQIVDQFPTDADWARDLMHRASNELQDYSPSERVCVVHGDLYARHILADESENVTGVIDWGDIHLGNPAIDLSIAYSVFRGDARTQFWQGYGNPPGQAGLARARAMMYALAMVAYGCDIGDPDAISLGRQIAENATAG